MISTKALTENIMAELRQEVEALVQDCSVAGWEIFFAVWGGDAGALGPFHRYRCR